MARSVTDAAILMGIISDIDFKGCSSDVSTCLPNQVLNIQFVHDIVIIRPKL